MNQSHRVGHVIAVRRLATDDEHRVARVMGEFVQGPRFSGPGLDRDAIGYQVPGAKELACVSLHEH